MTDKPRRRAIVLVLGLATLAVLLFLAQQHVRESWYLRELRSNDVAVFERAVESLRSLKSNRLVPQLVEVIRARQDEAGFVFFDGPSLHGESREIGTPALIYLTPRTHWLYRLGEDAKTRARVQEMLLGGEANGPGSFLGKILEVWQSHEAGTPPHETLLERRQAELELLGAGRNAQVALVSAIDAWRFPHARVMRSDREGVERMRHNARYSQPGMNVRRL